MPRLSRGSTVVRGVRGVRRDTAWLFIGSSSVTLTALGGTIINSLNAAALAMRPFTIVRMHLVSQIESDQSAASEFQAAAIGAAIVSDQASAIGVSAVPTPVTDLGSDLFFLHQLMMSSQFLGGADGNLRGHVYQIDSKAMRKVNDDQDLVISAEVDTGISNGANVRTFGRFLIKLH